MCGWCMRAACARELNNSSPESRGTSMLANCFAGWCNATEWLFFTTLHGNCLRTDTCFDVFIKSQHHHQHFAYAMFFCLTASILTRIVYSTSTCRHDTQDCSPSRSEIPITKASCLSRVSCRACAEKRCSLQLFGHLYLEQTNRRHIPATL